MARPPLVTAEDIERIKRMHAAGETQKAIAAATRFSEATIGRIVRGRHPLTPGADPDWGVRFAPTFEKCPDCGGIITESPCRLCLLDKLDPTKGNPGKD